MADKKRCRWCLEGCPVTEKGDHWIVKSVIPAKITIKKCIEHNIELESTQ